MTGDRGSRWEWLVFGALGLMWGSSYLFIKLGIETLTPLTLVALRLGIGAAVLVAIVAVAREPLPRGRRIYGHLAVLSLFSIMIPFVLITSAEQMVSSSLAAILTATVPLFVIVIAAARLRDEPVTVGRLAGLLVGFAGVVMVVGGGGSGDAETWPAQLALLGAAASYAIGGVYARRHVTGLRPMIPAVAQVSIAFVITSILALVLERPFELDFTPQAIGSVIWLGVLGSGLAYLAFFRLLRTWGATRTSLVAYLLPVVGIALGVVVAGETVDPGMIGGTLLVIGGIGLVNARFGQRPLFGRSPAPRAEGIR
jgi:drug/metabolite transporter (DMT)-like permease